MTVKIWERESLQPVKDPVSFTAILDDKGRIVIPATAKKRLKVSYGSKVSVSVIQIYKVYIDGGDDTKQ